MKDLLDISTFPIAKTIAVRTTDIETDLLILNFPNPTTKWTANLDAHLQQLLSALSDRLALGFR